MSVHGLRICIHEYQGPELVGEGGLYTGRSRDADTPQTKKRPCRQEEKAGKEKKEG